MLREDYPNEKDPEAKLYKDYKAWGQLAELEAMKPEPLDDRQQSILQLFYKCRQYSKDMERIPYEIINDLSENTKFEKDLLNIIIQDLDYEYLTLCNEKQKRDLENIKNNGARK